MNILGWHGIVFTPIFMLLATGLIVLIFSRSTYTKTRAIPYALMYGIGVAVWLASLLYTHFVADTFLTHRVSFSAGYILILGMLGLALTFPNKALGRGARRLLALDILVGSIFIGLIFFTNQVLVAANFAAGRTAPFSMLGKIYLLIVAGNLVLAIVIFVRRYLREVRNRLYFNYIVLAFILLFLIAMTTNLILPLTGIVTFALIGPLSALLPFITVVYALGITDINDINYVIAQLIQVGARLALLIGLFVAGIVLHDALGAAYYSSAWIIAMGVIAGMAIICFYLFGSAFDTYVEDVIAYSRLSPDKARARLVAGLIGEVELERNASLVLKLVKQTIGVRTVGIALLAKDGTFWASADVILSRTEIAQILKVVAGLPMRHANVQALINTGVLPSATKQYLEERGIYAVKPLHTESSIGGLYLLGEKFSQEVFTRQDASLMDAITEVGDLSIERALFYNQIQSFNKTLQQRIDDATQKLRKANEHLKTLDTLKDDFISMASHQLRSPAASVHEAVQLLRQVKLTSKERHHILELADASSERLVGVITDMLSIARIQAGHFIIDPSTVDMVELVDRAIVETSMYAKQRSMTLTFVRPKQPILLQADRPKLNEIIANYIENAIKYSPEGSTIHVALFATDNQQVRFEVSDNGIGVPAAERKYLFGKFYRATNARDQQPNGNGIGLFVVKTVVQAHGGDVYYQPLPHGSRFGFWLPLTAQG